MRKLYRSTRDKKIFGICGGLADYLNVDTTLLRVLLIIVAVFSAGSVIIVYIIAGFVIPREPNYGGGYGATPPPYGWGGREQPPQYGSQNWPPQSPSWNHSGQPPQPPRPPAPDFGKPPAYTPTTPAARPTSAPGIDQMMEDIEKKSLRREIEELKAKIDKIEKDSKGE
ncbi:PspC domain-containing protein [Cohnella yongneupensis]|uniref:PspC domain-containing protein n=1 Tax=Cohnella yongneupensis TaxID=425006 RepID=A0ABW0QZ58_9BACL